MVAIGGTQALTAGPWPVGGAIYTILSIMLPPSTRPDRPWHALPPQDVLQALGVTPAGLSQAEVLSRRAAVGPNRFQALKPASLLTLVIRQFRSILVLLLIVAGAISVMSGDRADAIAILAVLVLNGLIGFLTEWRARRAMEGLLALEVGRARVIRAGVTAEIGADELVPGDLIDLEAGQAVPADARLLSSTELEVAEAALTGESLAVEKNAAGTLPESTPLPARRNLVYKATTVMMGHGRAVVIATGMATEVGRIGALAAAVEDDRTPLERRLEALGRPLALAAVATAVLVALMALLRGAPLGLVVQTAIALAVAAVPEGLPAVATITLAIGVRRMARRHALVRRLPSVETLGSTTVICTDKTGTLTTGVMTATAFRLADREITVTGDPGDVRATFLDGATAIEPSDEPRLVEALRVGSLANRSEVRHDGASWSAVGDQTEAALLVAAHRAGLDPETFRVEWPEVGEVAFSSTRRIMATFHTGPEGLTACMKGAPAQVLDCCTSWHAAAGVEPLNDPMRQRLLAQNRELATRGLRVLALAAGRVARPDASELHGLSFVALVGLSDPPAPLVADTLARFRGAGIRTVMITGDQRDTASAVARSIGLPDGVAGPLDGADLDGLDEAALAAAVRQSSVFTRISPEAKVRLVQAFQRSGGVVAMLGDGVNDAAALRQADIGVAMGLRGTDLAKEAADMILADDRFATIGAAIEEGRVIHDNVRKAVLYLLACNVAELAVVFVATAAGWTAPLRPLQILWLNLLTDTAPALALALEPGEPDVMRRPPHDPRSPLLPRPAVRAALGYAALIAAGTLGAFAWGLHQGDPARASTLAFFTLALAQIFHLGNARQAEHVTTIARALANPAALLAVLLTAGLQVAAALSPPLVTLLHIRPLELSDWAVVLTLSLLPALVGQGLKLAWGAPPRGNQAS